jgi:hypothetical protein
MSKSSLLKHATPRRGNLNSELLNFNFGLFRQLNVGFLYIYLKHGHSNDRYFRNYRYCGFWIAKIIKKAIFLTL